ncbi:YaaR family protein [Turneriella parva]|uniref:DUF327 domain-containing protein n=1 Tax=Turneriella parva (strain ATCC BAA-1111 / DSM 21527 / NCTC 11395 / H) TaxID=869212 RepID=I4BB24_TURPD|nr:DUF327 family protein [Turneriella parva]AFM14481.1 protein of unknown function DUF327 [Turneriella parva DSM 21527]
MQQVQPSHLRPATGDLAQRAGISHAQAGEKNSAAAAQSGFSGMVSQILQKKTATQRGSTLEDLMANLDNDERDFADAPSRDRYEKYKQTVKLLCNMLIQRSYRLQGWEDKRQRRYEIIKTIDTRLAQLYSGLMRRNQDVVIALHLMGQIRGLIFDLRA